MDNLTPTLNDQQIRENIDAMQKQGVNNDKVQSYVDNYSRGSDGNYILKQKSGDNSFMGQITGKSEPSQYEKESQPGFNEIGQSIKKNALPVGGAVAGAIGGGILGTMAGGPVGGYLGATAGSSAGGALGETANQFIEKATGDRKNIDTNKIGDTALNMGVAEAVGGPLGTVAGKAISSTGEALYKAAIPTSAKEAKLLQSYKADVPLWDRVKSILGESKAPDTSAGVAFDKGLMGTESMIGVQAKKANKVIWNDLISPQLKGSNVKVNMPEYFNELEQSIIKNNPELSRQSSLLEGLKALKEDYAHVKDVSLEDLQKFKEGWAKFVPEKAYRGKPIAGVFNEVKDEAADLARTKIYDALGPQVKQAYFDYGNLKSIEELGQKAMTGGKLKGGAGSFITGIKDMLVTPVATIGGQTVYKVGQGIQLVGKPGARVVRDIIATPGN